MSDPRTLASILHADDPGPLRLFLIEDDEDIALLIRKSLERVDHQVTRCRTAADALIVLAQSSFDLVLLMHALTYSEKPALAIAEAARVLRRGGQLVAACLAKHEHRAAVTPYGHVNLGFPAKELKKFAEKAGLEVTSLETVTRERRPPHFEVISLIALKS